MTIPSINEQTVLNNHGNKNFQLVHWETHEIKYSEELKADFSNEKVLICAAACKEKLDISFYGIEEKELEQNFCELDSLEEEDFFGSEPENLIEKKQLITKLKMEKLVEAEFFGTEEANAEIEERRAKIEEGKIKIKQAKDKTEIKAIKIKDSREDNIKKNIFYRIITEYLKITELETDSNFLSSWLEENLPSGQLPAEDEFISLFKQFIISATKEKTLTRNGQPLTEKDVEKLFKKFEFAFREYYQSQSSFLLGLSVEKEEYETKKEKSSTTTQVESSHNKLDNQNIDNKLVTVQKFVKELPLEGVISKLVLKMIEESAIESHLQDDKDHQALEKAMRLHDWIVLKEVLQFELKKQLLKADYLKSIIVTRVAVGTSSI